MRFLKAVFTPRKIFGKRCVNGLPGNLLHAEQAGPSPDRHSFARDDPAAAERFGLALIEQAEALAIAPEMGVSMPERRGTRFLPFRSYLIIYRADVVRQRVHILRFWHGARGRRPMR